MFDVRTLFDAVKNIELKKYFYKSFILVFTVLTLVFGALTVIIFSYNKTVRENEIKEQAIISVTNYTNSVENTMDMIRDYYGVITADDYFMKFFWIDDVTTKSAIQYFEEFNLSFSQSLIFKKYIESIYLYSEKSDYIVTNTRNGSYNDLFWDKNWADKYYQENKSIFYRKIEYRDSLIAQNKEYISVVKFLQHMGNNGLVEFNISCESVECGDGFYWVDENNEIIFCKNRENIGKKINDNVEGYTVEHEKKAKGIVSDPIGDTGLRIVYMINEGEIPHYSSIVVVLVFILIFFIILSAFFAFFIVRELYNSVLNVAMGIDENTQYHDNERSFIKKKMLKEMKKDKAFSDEVQDKILLVNQAKAAALQAQMNPHTIYNSLNLIKVLELRDSGRNSEAARAVSALSKILRYAMSNNESSVVLEAELYYTDLYVSILKQKYSDKFSIEYNISPETKKMKVLKMSLQPVVENAVEHGIAPCEYKGKVVVSSFVQDNMLVIRVEDNGCGISEDKMENNVSDSYEMLLDKSHTHGLINTNERIKLLYGSEYGCRIRNRKDNTVIDILYPVLKED